MVQSKRYDTMVSDFSDEVAASNLVRVVIVMGRRLITVMHCGHWGGMFDAFRKYEIGADTSRQLRRLRGKIQYFTCVSPVSYIFKNIGSIHISLHTLVICVCIHVIKIDIC